MVSLSLFFEFNDSRLLCGSLATIPQVRATEARTRHPRESGDPEARTRHPRESGDPEHYQIIHDFMDSRFRGNDESRKFPQSFLVVQLFELILVGMLWKRLLAKPN